MLMNKKLTTMVAYVAITLASIILSGCGGSGGTDESSSSSKVQRHALEAEDITKNYDDSMIINPHIENVMGSLTYSIIESIPENIANIDPKTGQISVFNPGVLTVEVTDISTVYENSDDRFRVTIDKGINTKLSALPKYVSVDSNEDFVKAENYKGTVTYSVADDSRNRLNINSENGKLEPLSVGDAIVIIEDAGNKKYAPASITVPVTIKAITPGIIECTDFTNVLYSKGLTLWPQCLGGDGVTQYDYKIDAGGSVDQDVIEIDNKSGLMTVKKVGRTVVEVTVTYDDRYDIDSETFYFKVNILKGDRQDVSVENQTFTYSAGQVIQPNVSDAVGYPRYDVEGGKDVIEINETSGYPQIIGVGTANLRVSDDSNSNYPPSYNEFSYTVAKAAHPGLKPSTEMKRSYADGLTITPHIDGQKGRLKITGGSSAAAVSISGDTITVKRAGKIELSVKDLGDEFYLESNAVSLSLDIASADHPALEVTGLTTDYAQRCFPISDYVKGNKGELTVTTNLNSSIAKYNKESGCINVFKAGTTTLTLYSEESLNYKQSKPVNLPVIVNKVDGILTANDVSYVYNVGQPLVSIPVIGGNDDRKLSFEFATGSAEDVVGLDDVESSGKMKVLNAGTATIKVTDSGSEQQKSTVTFFNVKIEKADNKLKVKYPEEVFKANQSFQPVLTNNFVGMNTSFELTDGYQTVELVNSSTGELKIKGAGKYTLQVIASSRNYKQTERTVNGSVEKAPHPGLATPTVNVEYTPLKQYNVNPVTPAIGKRVFAIDPSQTKGIAEIDPNTGELTLLNYFGVETELVIVISEEGNQNYEGLDGVRLSVIINAPGNKASDSSVSRRDFTMAPVGIIYGSRLNQSSFKGLKETRVSFSGVRTIKAKADQLDKLGEGLNLYINMKPVGEEASRSNIKPVLFYAQRFDGCSLDYTLESVADGSAKAVPMDEDIACPSYGAVTQRYLTFIAVNTDVLTPGDWEIVTPFVVYRHSNRSFMPTSFGGCYTDDLVTCTGATEPTSKLHEWSVVNFTLTKSD